ncbi:MAG: hypothetical protein IT524_04045 [Nitrosomonas sp.]|nr:hypothetical protein [Nitrosomonas sp. JL21]MBL8496479.1 hypothetical protein [Nitrosomonas sp.]MCC7091122.1 hypothetical protein [Nitrosomonas sp.]
MLDRLTQTASPAVFYCGKHWYRAAALRHDFTSAAQAHGVWGAMRAIDAA